MAAHANSAFTREFWKSFENLGIYSKEDGPLLADQEDAGVAGGANSSDDTGNNSSETNEQNNDMNLDIGSDMGSSNLGGDLGGGMGGSDLGGDDSSGGGDLGGGNAIGAEAEPENPNENPFKKQNGQSLLDNKLAELQAAVSDSLQRIYSNPKIDTVVVSELETLLDSIRNTRETNYLIPLEQLQYKYKTATVTYAKLSKQLVEELNAEKMKN